MMRAPDEVIRLVTRAPQGDAHQRRPEQVESRALASDCRKAARRASCSAGGKRAPVLLRPGQRRPAAARPAAALRRLRIRTRCAGSGGARSHARSQRRSSVASIAPSRRKCHCSKPRSARAALHRVEKPLHRRERIRVLEARDSAPRAGRGPAWPSAASGKSEGVRPPALGDETMRNDCAQRRKKVLCRRAL